MTSIKNLPKAYANFIKGLKVTGELLKVTIKRIDDTVSAIIVNGQEIARMTKEKLIILERVFLESIDDNLQPVGQLVTPDGMIVQMDDGRTISDRVFDIMKDTQGKYKTAVAKINNAGGSFVNTFKTRLIDRISRETRMTMRYADDELKEIIENGKRLDLPDNEIEDIILNGCRDSKAFSKEELISQSNFWKAVKDRGYPNLFKSLIEYEKFSSVIKS
ncbi:hypothetical protein GCM10022393_42520 [Aquimarina addita]|uniref:Uncharacterized protein n=1 Tax=Aquimarina addita TaxID=870485 RepID=A0ABP6UXT6_9FLAO